MWNPDNYIGKSIDGAYIVQNVNEQGIIKGFQGFRISVLPNGQEVLVESFFVQNETIKRKIKNLKLKSGMKAIKSVRLPREIRYLDCRDTIHCEKCGQAHDSDSDSWINNKGHISCPECVELPDNIIKVDFVNKRRKGSDPISGNNIA